MTSGLRHGRIMTNKGLASLPLEAGCTENVGPILFCYNSFENSMILSDKENGSCRSLLLIALRSHSGFGSADEVRLQVMQAGLHVSRMLLRAMMYFGCFCDFWRDSPNF